MVVRVSGRVVPDDRDIAQCERSVVAAADGPVPCTVVWSQVQTVFFHAVFQPVPEYRMRFRVEIHEVPRIRLVSIAAYHVIIQVAFDLADSGECLHEIFGAEQSFLLSVPECENDGPFRPDSRSQERFDKLQDGGYTGSVVICSVIDIVSLQCRVETQMVVVCTYDYKFVRILPVDFAQDVVHLQFSVDFLFQQGDGVRVHLPAAFFLPLFTVCFKRLVIGIIQRLYPQCLQVRYDIFSGDFPPLCPGLTSPQGIACKKSDVCLRILAVDGFKTFFLGTFSPDGSTESQ